MHVNNCPKHTDPPNVCFPAVFGRFAFQSTDQNPLLGPTRATLIKMGGLYLKNVVHKRQALRLLSTIWVHEGLTQLVTDIVTLLAVAIPLERKFGFVRVGLLYVIYGLGGSIFSSLFIQTSVHVGASGAIAGLTGGSLSDIVIEYWRLHLPKGGEALLAITLLFINVAATIIQHGDNFALIGGSIFGITLGFVTFNRPPVNRLRFIAILVAIFVGLLTGMVSLFKGVDMNDHCSWCHYLDCVPFPGWSCKYRGIDCPNFELGNFLYMMCKGNGKTSIFPLTNGVPLHPKDALCNKLCNA